MSHDPLTVEQVRQAREAAADKDFTAYKIDWHLTNNDKRHGIIHAWTADHIYLGQFTTHERALGPVLVRLAAQ